MSLSSITALLGLALSGVTAVVKGWLGFKQEQAESTAREQAVEDRLKTDRDVRDNPPTASELDRWRK